MAPAKPAAKPAAINDGVDIFRSHLQLRDDGSIVSVTAKAWKDRVVGLSRQERVLNAFHAEGEDLHPHMWEMHPRGDELVHLLSGRTTLVLDEPDGERSVELTAGSAIIVPKGVWHRFLPLDEPVDILAVTPSLGTEMRPYEG